MKMYQILFGFFCLFSHLLATDDEMLVIESGMADYDGKKRLLTLSGALYQQ